MPRRRVRSNAASGRWYLKSAYLYKDDAGEKRVGPGDFLRVPGGHKHWSGGDKTEGALFYEEGSGKFDLIPAK
jgi:hypothetical protein